MSWFCIDDGSGCKTLCAVPAGVTIDPSWQHVAVTGISSLIPSGTDHDRLIRVRSQDDIVPY